MKASAVAVIAVLVCVVHAHAYAAHPRPSSHSSTAHAPAASARTQGEWINELVTSTRKHSSFSDFAHTRLKTRLATEDDDGVRLTDAELKQAPPVSIEERIDAFLRGLMACYQGLGLTVSVVRGDETVFAAGYGLRSVDPPLPVTTDTLFGIGSTTKAFTTTLLAMLEDEGLVDWDAPLTDYIPEFELEDQHATEHARLRDLVSHKLGLSRNDFWWIANPDVPRERLASHVKNFEMNLEFREKFQYNNFGFQIAGDVIARVLNGSSWEDELIERIFVPLGMSTATPYTRDAIAGGNYAFPYSVFEYDDDNRPVHTAILPQDLNTVIERLAPAGAIVASANDMQQWMKFQLAFGAANGEQLISTEALLKTWTPEMYSILSGILKPVFPASLVAPTYALGWQHSYYRGHALLEHSGGTLGHYSNVFLYPESGVGIFFSGIGDGVAITTIQYLAHMFIADLYLGYEPWLTVPNACTFPCTWVPCAEEEEAANATATAEELLSFNFDVGAGGARNPGGEYSLAKMMRGRKFNKDEAKCAPEAVQEFVGKYEHPGWGTLDITYSDELEMLAVSLHDVEVVLVDIGLGDVFGIAATNEYATFFGTGLFSLMTFNRDDQGRVVSVTGNEWDPTSEPTFERVARRGGRRRRRRW